MTESLLVILAIELGIIILGAVGIFILEAYALYLRTKQHEDAPMFKLMPQMLEPQNPQKAPAVVPGNSPDGQYL